MSSPNSFFYPYAYHIFTIATAQLIDLLERTPRHRKIILWSLEAINDNDVLACYKIVCDLGLEDRVHWILQPSHGHSDLVKDQLGNNLHLIDLDLLLLNLHTAECNTSVSNTVWNPGTEKFLFLTGKPNKSNRIRLLYKFYQKGILSQCNWSLFVNHNVYDQSRDLLPEMSDSEFRDFVTHHNRSPDGNKILYSSPEGIHLLAYPFDGDLYSDASFRVVSESQMLDRTIVTEKTWITMINHLPFIMAGYAQNLAYLKQQGYRTFENYLPRSEYDSIEDPESRLDAVVENTEFWLQNIQQQQHSVRQDIEHNHALLMSEIQRTIQQCKELANILGEPERSVYSLVPSCSEQERWAIFYYNVKARDWPDCLLEENFRNLPQEIQRECREKFGYHFRDSR